jgi:hypothetical protein
MKRTKKTKKTYQPEPMRRYRDRYREMIMGADAETQDWFWGPRRGGSGENRGLTTSAINRIVTTRSMELIKDEDGKPKRVTGHSRGTLWRPCGPRRRPSRSPTSPSCFSRRTREAARSIRRRRRR